MSRLDDYVRWHKAQVACRDIDPMYPLLREVADMWGLSTEQRVWLVFCHVTWYHPGSTFAAFNRCGSVAEVRNAEELGLLDLPTGTERRAHRSRAALARHLTALSYTLTDGAAEWVSRSLDRPPQEAWRDVSERLCGIYGNGRWAAYKTAEMLQKVVGYAFEAPDAGHRHSSGPRKGLYDLFGEVVPDAADNRPEAIASLDRITAALGRRLGEADVAQVETSLCDFHSLVRGHYYLGHDIDGMLADLTSPRIPIGSVTDRVWDARAISFNEDMLGEVSGWSGVRKNLNTVYRDSGMLVGV